MVDPVALRRPSEDEGFRRLAEEIRGLRGRLSELAATAGSRGAVYRSSGVLIADGGTLVGEGGGLLDWSGSAHFGGDLSIDGTLTLAEGIVPPSALDPVWRDEVAAGLADRRVPAAPVSVSLSSDVATGADGAPRGLLTVSWSAVTTARPADGGGPLNVASYDVDVRRLATSAWASTVATGTSTEVRDLEPGTAVEVRVRARSVQGAVPGEWSTVATILIVADTTPPPVPSPLVLSSELGVVSAAWDGLGTDAVPMSVDFSHVLVFAGSTASPTNVAGRLAGKGTLQLPGTPGATMYVRAKTVDRSGNQSAYCAVRQIVVRGALDDTAIAGLAAGLDAAQANAAAAVAQAWAAQGVASSAASDATASLLAASEAVVSSVQEWALGASETTAPTTGWSVTAPTRTPGTWIWMRIRVERGTGAVVYSSAALVTGNQGAPGTPGAAGKGVTSIVEEYYSSTSSTAQSGGSWVTSAPAWVSGKYIWTRSEITYTDASVVTTSPVCVSGADGTPGTPGAAGRAVSTVDVEYYLSTSSTALAGGSWVTTAPAWADGKFMWSRTVTTYSTGSPTVTAAVCITGGKGATGDAAASVWLVASTQVLTGPAAGGATSPAAATVTGAAANTTITVWQYSVDGGAFSATVPAGCSRSGNVVTVTGAAMTAKTVAVRMADAAGVADTLTVAKITHGAPGADGADAVTVLLSNEAHVFAGSATAALAGSTTSTVIAYKGAAGQAATVGTITGQVTGLTTSITGNGTTAPIITVSVTTALTTQSGVLSVPVTVDGKTVTKTIAWSVSRAGAPGGKGDTGNTGAAGVSVVGVTSWYQLVDTGSPTPALPGKSLGNLVRDPMYSGGIAGYWGALSGGSAAYSTEWPYPGGERSIRFVGAPASAYGPQQNPEYRIPVIPGEKYTARAWWYATGRAATTGNGFSTQLYAYDAANELGSGNLSAGNRAPSATHPIGEWFVTGGAPVTMAEDRASVTVRPTAYLTGTSDGSVYYLGRVDLRLVTDWTDTEPSYAPGKELWRAELVEYSDGTHAYTEPTKSSAYAAAVYVGNLAELATKGLVKVAATDPGHYEGRIWWQLGTGDKAGQCIAIKISNGTVWASYMLAANDVLVPGSVKAGSIDVADLVAQVGFFQALVTQGLMVGGGEMHPDPRLLRPSTSHNTATGVTLATTDGEGPGDGSILIAAAASQRGTYTASGVAPRVVPGETYVLSARVQAATAITAAGRVSLYASWRDATGALLLSTAKVANPASVPASVWTTISGVTIPAPAGAVTLEMGVYTEAAYNAQARFSSLSIRQQNSEILMRDGGITAPKIAASVEMSAKLAQFLKVATEHMDAGSIDVDRLNAGTFRGKVIQGPVIISNDFPDAPDNVTIANKTITVNRSDGEGGSDTTVSIGGETSDRITLAPVGGNPTVYLDADSGSGGVTGTWSVRDLLVDGDRLATILDQRPGGVLAYWRDWRSSVSYDATEQPLVALTCGVRTNRLYKVVFSSYVEGTASALLQFRIRWKTGSGITIADTLLSSRTIQFAGSLASVHVETIFEAPADYPDAHFLVSGIRSSGSPNWNIYGGIQFPSQAWIEDIGPGLKLRSSTQFAPAGGTAPGGKAEYTSVYGATWQKAWRGSTAVTDYLHWGYWGGYQRYSMVGFGGSLASDLSGATITKVEARLQTKHTWNGSSGLVRIGSATNTSAPGSPVTSGTVAESTVTNGATQWLPVGGFTTSSRAITLGVGAGTGNAGYGKAAYSGVQLRVIYSK